MNQLGFHIRLTSLMGTADHLISGHGFTEADIERDDPHGLVADHIRFHGGEVRHDGSVRLPASVQQADIRAAHAKKVGA